MVDCDVVSGLSSASAPALHAAWSLTVRRPVSSHCPWITSAYASTARPEILLQ